MYTKTVTNFNTWHKYKVPWWRFGPFAVQLGNSSCVNGQFVTTYASPGDEVARVLGYYMCDWRYRKLNDPYVKMGHEETGILPR